MTRPPIAVALQVPAAPPLRNVQALLWTARLARLDSVFVADHFQGFLPRALWDAEFSWAAGSGRSPDAIFDFQTLLGWFSSRAGRLRLGVGVTEPTRRHPVLIAQAMMTLAHLTSRPPILGLGSGERENIEPYGLDFSTPVDRLEEALQVIRLCFTSAGPVDFHGRHFQLEQAVMDLAPPTRNTPEIWIAAHGPRMLRLTGRYADGWYPTVVRSPGDYSAKLAVIHETAVSAGRQAQQITPSLLTRVVLAPTEKEARAMLESKPVRFVALLAPAEFWRASGARHPFGDEFRGYVDFVPGRYSRKALREAMELVPVEALAEGVLWGTPLQVVEKIRDFGDAGLRHIVLTPLSALISRRSALYALRSLRGIAAMLRRPD